MSKSTRHSAILITAYITTLLLNYTFGIALSWYLEPDQFGVLGFSQSLLLLIALAVGSGFAWTANHEIASSGATDSSRRVFRASFLANTAMGALIAAGLVGAYTFGLLPLGSSYTAVIPLIGATTVLLSARAVINGAGRGLFRFAPVSINLVLEVLVKILVGIALVAAGFGVAGVMLGFAMGAAVSLLHSAWIIRDARLWSGRGWLQTGLLRKTVPLFVGMLSTALMLNLDVLGLKLFSGSSSGDTLVGYYQAVVILSRSPVFIAQAISVVTFSYASLNFSQNGLVDPDASREVDTQMIPDHLARALRAWARLLLPAGALLILAPKAALLAFFPPEYQVTSGVLQVCAAGAILLALVTLWNSVLQTTDARRKASLATAGGIIIQLVLLAELVPLYGIWGPAISLLGGSAVALALILLEVRRHVRLREELAIPPSRWALGLLPWVALALPLLMLPDTSRWFAVVQVAMSAVFYGLVLFLVSMHPGTGRRTAPRRMLSVFVKELLGG